MPIYLFFDLDKDLIREIKKVVEKLQYPIEDHSDSPIQFQYHIGDVRELKDKVDVFVSPANSYGYMDGGIDEIYSQMYPGIQQIVQNRINEISPARNSYTNKRLLAIGAALTVKLPNDKKTVMVAAPTMEVPHSIRRNPENVYLAMTAILKVTQHLGPNTIIAIPGLGTGVGGLHAQEAAAQIYYAFDTILNFRPIQYPKPTGIKFQANDHYILDVQVSF